VTTVSAGDADLLDGSPGSGVAAVSPPQTIVHDGHNSVSGTATDQVGRTASTTATFDVDSAPPAIAFTCPASVLLNAAATAAWHATDTGSGLATPATGTVTLDTTHIGTFASPVATATDNVGHMTTSTCTYTVIWAFSGFFSPVNNLPTLNTAKAGSAIPVKFSLAGDQGLAIFASGYPVTEAVSCATDAATSAIEETVTAGGSSLSFDGAQYVYVWKTNSAWAAGTCRALIVKLADGTTHRVDFKWR
jgi:hypothetical protein